LALGGGGALLVWALAGFARGPLRIVALAGLYLAPGLALLRLLWPRDRALTVGARVALALGLSVALPPLLLLLFQQLRLPWGAGATWGYLLLSLAVCLGLAIKDRRPRDQVRIPRQEPAELAFFGIALAALIVRLYAVRDLSVGLLGDSYHHTLMTQLLVENRGLFHSWQPYAPLASFTYHFGFHANAAFVHYIAGVDVPRSVVWTGQILNALVVPMVFALALVLGGSRWAGVWAALIVGFVSNLPAFFVNWGRYTQLAGQIVLIAVVVCWISLFEPTKDEGPRAKTSQQHFGLRFWSFVFGGPGMQSWKLLLLTALATAAMLLTHYLVAALAVAFVVSYLGALTLAYRSWRFFAMLALRAAFAAVLALLLVAPWFLNVLGGHLLRNATGLAGGGGVAAAVAVPLSTLEPVVPKYVHGVILLGALVGLLIAVWRRDWRMTLLAVWCALLVLMVVPYIIGLPGSGVIDNITSLGTLYIPIALLAGYALAVALERGALLFGRQSARGGNQLYGESVIPVLAAALLLLTVAANAGWQASVVTGDTALVAEADLAAMQWIGDNTPASARFVINSFPSYGGTLAAGNDAGWWLPLLANRATTLPPLTYGSEQAERRGYQVGVNALAKKLRGRPLTDLRPVNVDLTRPVALKALADNQIDYVYSGAHPYPGPEAADRIDTAKLRASPAFRLVYERDGVEIFQFLKSAL
jgi:hypothetical protein